MGVTLSVNMLIEYPKPEGNSTKRILWIDPSGSDVIMIDVEDSSAMPNYYKSNEVISDIQDGIAQTVQRDSYSYSLQEQDIPEEWRKRRNEAWELIKPLIDNNSVGILNPKIRGPLIELLHQETGKRKTLIYQYLRRYWQGGQVKNALIPRFNRCGAPGKTKPDYGNKLGRPSALGKIDKTYTGVNVDDDIKAKILIGGKTFYEAGKHTLKDAWRLTNRRFFMVTEVVDGEIKHNNASNQPSYDQFIYWYRKLRDYELGLRKREGDRKVDLNFRPLVGRSTDIAFGPGSVFQIDATLGDVYLISIFDRTKIIGRPIVYLVVDVFSEMIVGVFIGIENMSRVSAMMAIENTLSDKVSFCQHFGIDISEKDWPCQHKPEILLADRAELIGYYGDHLVNSLGISVANTAPYRADMKGLVEQCFNLLNIRAIHQVPGETSNPRERGDHDPRLDATLNIYEFTQLIINTIIYLNKRRLNNYPFNEDLIQQHVDLRPINLWDWGIVHRNGCQKAEDPKKMQLILLPREVVSVREDGIHYKKHTYTSPELVPLQMKARREGSFRREIAYHPLITNQIYLLSEDKEEYTILTRAQGGSSGVFRCASFYDIDSLNYQETISKAIAEYDDRKEWANLYSANHRIVQKAAEDKKRQTNSKGKVSKKEQIENINKNREDEKMVLRTAFQGIRDLTPPEEVMNDDDSYIAPVIDLKSWSSQRLEDN